MAGDVVEVRALLGESLLAVAHGASITIGETGEVFAPMPTTTVSIDAVRAHAIRAGLVTLEIRRVAAPAEHLPRPRFERRPAMYVAISMLVHLALWGTSMRFPGETVSLGAGARHPYMVMWRATPAAPPVTLDDDDEAFGISMSLHDPRDGIGPRRDARGHAGIDENRSDRPTDMPTDMPTDTSVDARRAAALEAARDAGFLEAAVLGLEHRLGDILGTGSPARDVSGSAGAGEVGGSFASERRLAGGCTGEDCGTIGTSRYATVCAGPGGRGPCAYGEGNGIGAARGRVAAVPEIYLCGSPDGRGPSPCVVIEGSLDKTIIRRYLRRKLGAFQACYERALLSTPDLALAVETSFIIDATGRTRDISATGVRDDIAACVATVIESIQFPLSRNGGVTRVHYPLSFHVAGS